MPPHTNGPVVMVVMRHGERHDVVHGIDEADTALTPNGIADVAGAAGRLGAILRSDRRVSKSSVDAPLFVASPFRRTLETASALRDNWDARVSEVADFDPAAARHRVRIDPGIGEVFGPQRIKVAVPPQLESWPDVLPDAEVPAALADANLCPAEWGEDAPAAHARLTRSFQRHAKEQSDSGGGVRVLVTHGDALQAIVAAVRPGRVVYDCAYLGFAVLRQRRPGGPWRVVALDGIMTFDENEDGTPISEPGDDEMGSAAGGSPGASPAATDALPDDVAASSPFGSPSGDCGDDHPSAVRSDPALNTPSGGAVVVVEVREDTTTPIRDVSVAEDRVCRAAPDAAASPYGMAHDSGGTPPEYSVPRQEEGARYRARNGSREHTAVHIDATGPSTDRGVDKQPSEDDDVDDDGLAADVSARFRVSLRTAVGCFTLPRITMALSFPALQPQTALPTAILLTTVPVTIVAATAFNVFLRRRGNQSAERFALVGSKKESATDAVIRLAKTRRQAAVAACWTLLSLVLSAGCVSLAALIAKAINPDTDQSVLVSQALWTEAAWLFQWALIICFDVTVGMLTPL